MTPFSFSRCVKQNTTHPYIQKDKTYIRFLRCSFYCASYKKLVTYIFYFKKIKENYFFNNNNHLHVSSTVRTVSKALYISLVLSKKSILPLLVNKIYCMCNFPFKNHFKLITQRDKSVHFPFLLHLAEPTLSLSQSSISHSILSACVVHSIIRVWIVGILR
jgi:hypothetical protein